MAKAWSQVCESTRKVGLVAGRKGPSVGTGKEMHGMKTDVARALTRRSGSQCGQRKRPNGGPPFASWPPFCQKSYGPRAFLFGRTDSSSGPFLPGMLPPGAIEFCTAVLPM